MKSPRKAGPTLYLALAMTAVALALAPRASAQGLTLASFPDQAGRDAATPAAMARKPCRFGQRYSPYYRRCVLWTPFDLT